MGVPVTAQWALWSTEAVGGGYGLRDWSDGPLGRRMLVDAITRSLPGSGEDRPQVTISFWFVASVAPQEADYLAMAIHDPPSEGKAYGRPVLPTRYFYLRFEQLLAGAVSYRALFEGLNQVALPTEGRSPVELELPVPQAGAPPGELAVRVAALLWARHRVCIAIDDEHVIFDDRLRFLDDVASLLPYGMRSRLSCATWGAGTISPDIDLFFVSRHSLSTSQYELRATTVPWRGEAAPTGDPAADEYMQWLLADVPGRVAELREKKDSYAIRQLQAEIREEAEQAAALKDRYDREREKLDELTRELDLVAGLVEEREEGAELGSELRDFTSAVDAAVRRSGPGLGAAGAPGNIPARQEVVDQLADLASQASQVAEEAKAAVLNRYEADVRDLAAARDRVAALEELAAAEGAGSELLRAVRRLGAEMDATISASSELGEMLAQPAPDVEAAKAILDRPPVLAAQAQQVIRSAPSQLAPRLSVSCHYPKLIPAGPPSKFLVQIFPRRRHQAAAELVKAIFPETETLEAAWEARLRQGAKVRISLTSQSVDFAAPVWKRIVSAGIDTTFQGTPKASAPPGINVAVIAICDEDGVEILSLPFDIYIVDYAFDHVSRPFAGGVIGGVAGALAVCMLVLALIMRTGQVLTAISGAIGLALSGLVFAWINSLFRRQSTIVRGTSQDP
jgi:hypothetical protein